MRALVLISFLCAIHVDTQSPSKFSDFSQQFWANLFRQGKTVGDRGDLVFTTPALTTSLFTKSSKSTKIAPEFTSKTTATTTTGISNEISTLDSILNTNNNNNNNNNSNKTLNSQTTPISTSSLPISSTELFVDSKNHTSIITSTIASTSTINSDLSTGSTLFDTTTSDYIGTTGEPREIPNSHDFYLINREKPFIKISSNISQNLLPLPAGAGAALVKPTKYHYYPHNQHIYLLPECAIQQVCNAVYVRLNWTQPLCACPSRYRDPCSASLNSDDLHTTELSINKRSKKALTLVKTCEPTNEMRICRAPRDWSLLALQNIRTGKSHYLVICRCPQSSVLEGPMSHDQPTYASVPGIRVYGMMCVDNKHRDRPRASRNMKFPTPPFPWKKVKELMHSDAIWA